MDALNDFAYSLVATPPSPATSGTSLTVTAGQGALFPAPPFSATIWPAGVQPLSTNAEIVRVTAVSTDTFTITRAQEGTTAQSITAGYQIAQTVTAGLLQELAPLSGATFTGQVVVPDLKVTGLTGATASSSRLVGTTTSGPPTSGTFTAGDIVADQTGTFWLCVSSGTPGTWTNEVPNSLVNRSATATAGVGEFTIYGTSGTSGQTITLPANPQNGAIYQIKNLSPYTVNILGGTNSISVSGTVYGAATPYTIPLNAAYSFAFSGGVWYCFLTTDLAKQSGVLPIANGGTNSATGALPLTGDVTGTATASVVGAIQGKSIGSTQATVLSQLPSTTVTHNTASNPTVTAGEFSVVPSSGVTGALTLTLPSAPANGTINYIAIQNTAYGFTLQAGGTDKIQNGASSVSSFSLPYLYTDYVLQYFNGIWYTLVGPFNGITGSGASVFATSPTLTTPTLNVPTLKSALETAYVDTTALNGTYNVYVSTNGSLILNTGTPSANFTFNVASTSSVALNTLLAVGGAVTFTVLVTNGSSNAYYLTGISVDGTSQTVNWQGGSAPSTPALSTMYAYTVTIIKTAANTYTVLASQTQF